MDEENPHHPNSSGNKDLPPGTAGTNQHQDNHAETHEHADESSNGFYGRLKRSWNEASFHDNANVILTLVLAASTTIYVIVAICTLSEIKTAGQKASQQTSDLIAAAEIQACAASKNAEAAASFALSADGIKTKTGEAVTQFQHLSEATTKAANAAKKAADTAEREALITEENVRAVVSAKLCKIVRIDVEEKITAHCDFTNTGHSVAFNVRVGSDTQRWREIPDGPMPVKIPDSGDNLAGGSDYSVTFVDSVPATIGFLNGLPELTVNDDPGNITMFFFTRFEYFSLGRPHHTEICFHLTKSNPAADSMPEAKTGYVLRECKKWHSGD